MSSYGAAESQERILVDSLSEGMLTYCLSYSPASSSPREFVSLAVTVVFMGSFAFIVVSVGVLLD